MSKKGAIKDRSGRALQPDPEPPFRARKSVEAGIVIEQLNSTLEGALISGQGGGALPQ
jgi:hypothetical protein